MDPRSDVTSTAPDGVARVADLHAAKICSELGCNDDYGDFLQTVNERVVVYDGAMGTNIQFRNPTPDDFWGKEGCNELLVLSRPDIIRDIHAAFLEVGCDVVETDTFGASRIVLAEYGLAGPRCRTECRGRQTRALRGGGLFHVAASRASWPAPLGRPPSCRRWSTSASTTCAPPTSSRSRR